MKVKNLLPEEAAEILTEESLQTIEEAFSEKLKLTVESALAQQDELYAAKLQQLIKAIDKDHTNKLKVVVESIDRNNANKLLNVVKKYENEISQEANNFKTTIVESISTYLEEFLDEALPKDAILEATKNNTAREVLGNLRRVLAVDSALMSESVKEGVIDAKNQISELQNQVAELSKQDEILKEGYNKTKSALLLEEKTQGLTEKKKEYIKRVLNDKSPKFIEENFDYTLRLFERKEQERIDLIKEEAFSNRKVKADAPVIRESAKPTQSSNPYLDELKRIK